MGEGDVADAAVVALPGLEGVAEGVAAFVAFVEEVVQGHGEHEDGLAVGRRVVADAEVEAEAVAEHAFVGGGDEVAPCFVVEVAAAAHDLVIEHAALDGQALEGDDQTTARLEVEAAEVLVVGLEDQLLALEEDTGVETHEGGCPRGVDAYAEVAHLLEWCGEGAVVGAIDIGVVCEALFGHANGEDEVGTGE